MNILSKKAIKHIGGGNALRKLVKKAENKLKETANDIVATAAQKTMDEINKIKIA